MTKSLDTNEINATHCFWEPSAVISKSRPRFHFLTPEEKKRRQVKAIAKGKTPDNRDTIAYLDKRYRDWKGDTVENLTSSESNIFGRDWNEPSSYGDLIFPVSPVSIHVDFFGAQRGDRDNQFGSVMDALVGAEIIGGLIKDEWHFHDAPSFIPQGSYSSWKCNQRKGALITLTKVNPKRLKITEAEILEEFLATPNNECFIWMPGKCFSKLRPRGFKGKVKNDPRYRYWKNTSVKEIIRGLDSKRKMQSNSQTYMIRNRMKFPSESLEVSVSFVGKGHLGDCDNRLAAVMDVLVAAKLCQNDGPNCVPHGKFETLDSPKEIFGTIIKIRVREAEYNNDFFASNTKAEFHDINDLIAQGWTKGLVEKHLSPDEIRANPTRRGKTLELYSPEKVKLIIENMNLQAKLEKNLIRRSQ